MVNRLISLTSFVIVFIFNSLPTLTYAQTSDICTFSEYDFGNLVTDGNTLPTKLVNYGASGGNTMQMAVTCNQPAKIAVSQPIQSAGPKFNPVSALATIQTASGNTTNSNSPSLIPLPAGRSYLLINLSIDKGSVLQPGNYKYGVRFTIFP
jgi:hypothetical protein